MTFLLSASRNSQGYYMPGNEKSKLFFNLLTQKTEPESASDASAARKTQILCADAVPAGIGTNPSPQDPDQQSNSTVNTAEVPV